MHLPKRTLPLMLLILTALLSASGVTAQNLGTPIYSRSNAAITNVSWSQDSTTLVFHDAVLLNSGDYDSGVQTIHNTWIQYQLSGNITTSNQWYLQPPLSVTQQQHFQIAQDGGQTSFIFRSPNQRYIVYATQKPIGWEGFGWPLALGDLRNGQHVFVGKAVVWDLTDFDYQYRVQWSDDSATFTVRTSSLMGDEPRIYYVHNYDISLDNLVAQYLLQGISLGSETSYPDSVFDLSTDGSKVLLEDTVLAGRRLLLWDVVNPSQSRVLTVGNYVLAAVFAPGNEGKIWFLDEHGLTEYNLGTQAANVLNPYIKAAVGKNAWFAPNGENIALLESSHPGSSSMYIVNLPPHP